MSSNKEEERTEVPLDQDLWNRFYTVHSLVIIGSKEADGSYNLAPKHMAMPMGFTNYFAFIGTPRKTTYQNVKREGVFTVSYPRPDQLVLSSLSASQRADDHSKEVIKEIPTVEAQKVEGKFLENAYLQLECKLTDIMGKFGEWELIVGEVIAAYADPKMLRNSGEDSNDEQVVYENPILAYLHPDRFSIIKESNRFPFPKDFKR